MLVGSWAACDIARRPRPLLMLTRRARSAIALGEGWERRDPNPVTSNRDSTAGSSVNRFVNRTRRDSTGRGDRADRARWDLSCTPRSPHPRETARDGRDRRRMAHNPAMTARLSSSECAECVPKRPLSAVAVQVRPLSRAVCKTVGFAYPGSNPGPATIKCPGQTRWHGRLTSNWERSARPSARGPEAHSARSSTCGYLACRIQDRSLSEALRLVAHHWQQHAGTLAARHRITGLAFAALTAVIGLFVWARIDDQRHRYLVTGYPGRPPGFQDHEDIRGSMHAGRRQRVADVGSAAAITERD